MVINGDLCHDVLVKEMKHKLSFDENKDFAEYRKELKTKLFELLGIDKIELNACAENMIIESEEKKDGYRLIRFVFESEKNNFVPCYLAIPDTGKQKYPVAITLQGHKSGGMYNSVGIVKNPDDEAYQPRGSFALQAVKEGFAALAIELRGMSGEMQPSTKERMWGGTCAFAQMTAFMLGRTLLGERCWDVSHAIDLLKNFPELDATDVTITGNSGGGTMSFYAACYDERIKLSAPSCAFCPYEDSVLRVYHCTCNFIPHAYEWFEMQDLAALIAPRKLLVIAGKDDRIFPLYGVEKGFETVKKIYEKAGAKDNCRLVVTPKDHYWCEDIVWPAINDFRK